MDSGGTARSLPRADEKCPAAALLTLLRGRWTTSLVYCLGNRGTARFGELQRALEGISPKVLTDRLRALEGHGLVWRAASDDVPPKVSYGLSDKGVDVHASLALLEAPTRRVLDGESD